MRTYDFTPLFRSTVGFDRLFDLIDSSVRPDWPPYNIEKKGENQFVSAWQSRDLHRTRLS